MQERTRDLDFDVLWVVCVGGHAETPCGLQGRYWERLGM